MKGYDRVCQVLRFPVSNKCYVIIKCIILWQIASEENEANTRRNAVRNDSENTIQKADRRDSHSCKN